MNKSLYRKDIDGLRTVAVVPVVLNHAGLPIFPGGFTGVDIFFVISGYLITSILVREIEAGDFSILRFYERRARRILPALFVVLATCLVIGWFLLSPQRYEALSMSVIATLGFVSNIWFWLSAGDYFSPTVEFEPLLHTWSLAVEEQFYLVFPLLLAAIASLKRSIWIAIVAAISFASLVLSVFLTSVEPAANFYLVLTRAWELGAGALLALGALPVSRSRRVHETAGLTGLVLIAVSLFLVNDSTPFPGLAAVPAVLGSVLIIYAGSGHSVWASRLLSVGPFVWIGLISYSLYLWHWPILVAAREITRVEHLSPMAIVVCVSLSFLAAWLSWRFVEQPFRKSKGAKSFSGKQIFAFSGAGIAVLGLVGVVVAQKDGFLGQFPADRVAVYKQAIQRDPVDKRCTNSMDKLPCLIGTEGASATFAVWGDSHAGAIAPGFDDWLTSREEGGLAYAKQACPPLIDVFRVDQSKGHGCDTHNSKVLQDILAQDDIKTVVLFGRWALAFNGTRAPRELGENAVLAATGSEFGDISRNPEVFEKGLGATVQALLDGGKQVAIIRGIPEIGLIVPDLVIRFGDAIPPNLAPTKEIFVNRNKEVDRFLDSLSTYEGVTVVQTGDVLCDISCKLQVEGEPLYRDDDHLSRFGARWLVPQLMARFETQSQSSP